MWAGFSCAMGVIRHYLHPKNQQRHSTPATAIALLFIIFFFFFFFFFFTEASSTIPLSAHLPHGRGLVGAGEKRQGVMKKATVSESLQKQQMMRLSRRRLGGLGSSPPTCRFKCGRCWPCKPVHVPIQPGQKMPLEYYPEAWRCKCGNKLFMP